MNDNVDSVVGWKPIATAPKDGTVVLGWSKRHGMSIGPVADYKHPEMPAPKNSNVRWFQPTHWHALPCPPNDQVERTQKADKGENYV